MLTNPDGLLSSHLSFIQYFLPRPRPRWIQQSVSHPFVMVSIGSALYVFSFNGYIVSRGPSEGGGGGGEINVLVSRDLVREIPFLVLGSSGIVVSQPRVDRCCLVLEGCGEQCKIAGVDIKSILRKEAISSL